MCIRDSFNNVIGNPLDTTVALHHLIFDGTLEKFPNLKIFVAPKLMGSEAQPLFKLPLAAMSSAIGLTIDDVSAVGDDWLFSCSLSSS